MNLDDLEYFRQIDQQNMLAHIDNLPNQLEAAWELAQRLPLPEAKNIQHVIITGMGGSAMGGDLLEAYSKPFCSVPVVLNRDYDLPHWARGASTLVIAASHSGNTEETVTALQQAIDARVSLMVLTTNGKLAQVAHGQSLPLWQYDYPSQPRAALGYSFTLLLAAFSRLGFIPDQAAKVASAVQTLRLGQSRLNAEVPAATNPAKRMAGQLIDRLVTVIGPGMLAPVARRWKNQFNELAKAWGACEALPEADHNLLAAAENPAGLLSRLVALFLRSPSDHPRNRLRSDLTREAFMLQGVGTDPVDASGETRLAQLWSLIQFGDYSAYYLAMAYGVDPTPIAVIDRFKEEISAA